jgi:hypothetical protein
MAGYDEESKKYKMNNILIPWKLSNVFSFDLATIYDNANSYTI